MIFILIHVKLAFGEKGSSGKRVVKLNESSTLTCNSFSFYGKCLESVRKYTNVKLVKSESTASFQTSKPNYIRFKIFGPDLVGVQLRKERVKLDRPIAVGVSVLELSKLTMYQFWYEVLKKRYKNIQLCFTGGLKLSSNFGIELKK